MKRYDPGYTLGQPRQPKCSMLEAADGAWVSWDDVWRLMGERDRERDAGNAEVAALRAEVERLRAQLVWCGDRFENWSDRTGASVARAALGGGQ